MDHSHYPSTPPPPYSPNPELFDIAEGSSHSVTISPAATPGQSGTHTPHSTSYFTHHHHHLSGLEERLRASERVAADLEADSQANPPQSLTDSRDVNNPAIQPPAKAHIASNPPISPSPSASSSQNTSRDQNSRDPNGPSHPKFRPKTAAEHQRDHARRSYLAATQITSPDRNTRTDFVSQRVERAQSPAPIPEQRPRQTQVHKSLKPKNNCQCRGCYRCTIFIIFIMNLAVVIETYSNAKADQKGTGLA